MFISVGKSLMVLIWFTILSAPITLLAPYWLWLWLGGIILLLMHGVQMLAIRLTLSEGPLWRSGDSWRLLFFGFFALLSMKKRQPQMSSPQQSANN
jgi:uncharacterized protein YhhL (DUF1145 family)